MSNVWGKKKCTQGFNGETLRVKYPIGSPMRIWEDNIKIDVKELGWGGYELDSSGCEGKLL